MSFSYYIRHDITLQDDVLQQCACCSKYCTRISDEVQMMQVQYIPVIDRVLRVIERNVFSLFESLFYTIVISFMCCKVINSLQ